jgi:large subunit ribosomal protein L4
MPEIPLYNMNGEHIGAMSLPDNVFGVPANQPLVHQAVVTEEANRRQGTADTKTRGLISGGGRKPWRQKGTGHARQGSTRAPHWRHGGVVFGPHPRDYAMALPKKMRRGALRAALSGKVADGEVIGVDRIALERIRTKDIVAMLEALPLKREVATKHWEKVTEGDNAGEVQLVRATKLVPHKVLVVIPEYDPVLLKSCRNLPHVTLRYAPNFSVRDVVTAGRVVLAQDAVSRIEEVLG